MTERSRRLEPHVREILDLMKTPDFCVSELHQILFLMGEYGITCDDISEYCMQH